MTQPIETVEDGPLAPGPVQNKYATTGCRQKRRRRWALAVGGVALAVAICVGVALAIKAKGGTRHAASQGDLDTHSVQSASEQHVGAIGDQSQGQGNPQHDSKPVDTDVFNVSGESEAQGDVPGHTDATDVAASPTASPEATGDKALVMTGRRSLCYPKNAGELKSMVEDESQGCHVVVLQAGTTYLLSEPITVCRPVSILGNPAARPTIDGSNTARCFMIESGGVFDLRYVALVRGRPQWVIPDMLEEVRGGCLYIRAGARVYSTGVWFRNRFPPPPESPIQPDLRVTSRLIGGQVLQEGGLFVATGCTWLTFRPGRLLREDYIIGGSVLVVSGTAVITGCYFFAALIFVNVISIGTFFGLLAGVAIITGTVYHFTAGFVAAAGAGFLVFNGAGVVIGTGIFSQSNIGFYAFWGAALDFFTGAGVSVLAGVEANADILFGAQAGIGIGRTIATGISIQTGVSFTQRIVGIFSAALGAAQFVGAGIAVWTGINSNLFSVLFSSYGYGGLLHMGAGFAQISYCAAVGITVLAMVVGGGGDVNLWAGRLNVVGYQSVKYSVIAAFIGQGADFNIGAGTLYMKDSNFAIGSARSWANSDASMIAVGGRPVNVNPSGLTFKATPDEVYIYANESADAATEKSMQAVTIANVRVVNGWSDDVRAAEGGGEVHGKALEGLADLAEWMGRHADGHGGLQRSQSLLVRVDVEACLLCDVEMAGKQLQAEPSALWGPGADSCTVAQSCDGSELQPSPLAAGSSDDSDDSPTNGSSSDRREGAWAMGNDGSLPDTSLLIVELVATHGGSAWPDATHVKHAVAAAARALGVAGGYKLQAVTAVVDDLFASVGVGDGGGDGSGNDGGLGGASPPCSRESPFRAYFVSDSRAVTDRVNAAFTESTRAEETLTKELRDSLAGHGGSGSGLCTFAVTATQAYFVPGTGSLDIKGLFGGSGVPVVELVGSSSGKPVTKVRRGRTYTVSLENFMPGPLVSVSLARAGEIQKKVLGVISLSTRAEGSRGQHQWDWKVEKGLYVGKRYYIELVSALGDLAYSQAFEVL